MQQPLFHVLLEGRKLGPYDRRTIVGMRIKKALTSEHVLIDAEGMQLTVADLIGGPPRSSGFSPNRTGGHSVMQARYPASVAAVQGKGGFAIPAFKGEVEARVHADVLRIAGRFWRGLGWKEGRVKLPLHAIVHARATGTEVDLGLRAADDRPLQRLRLELFTPEAAAEFVDWLPDAAPWPQAAATAPAGGTSLLAGTPPLLWIAVASATLVAFVLLAAVLAAMAY